jgi:ADP-L-glycero-D-manno-heptose 6-epimerase
MILKGYEQIRETGRIRLFASDRTEYGDGEQDRDFIYVKDTVEMTLFFWERPDVNGIFNIGSGAPATWNMLARAIFNTLGQEPVIEYVNMPEHLKGKYQYHTCALMEKLRAAGYTSPMTPFADAVREYIRDYLKTGVYLTNP